MGFARIEKGIEPIDGFLTDLEYECDAEVNNRIIQKLTAAMVDRHMRRSAYWKEGESVIFLTLFDRFIKLGVDDILFLDFLMELKIS